MSVHRDTLEKTQACDVREISQLERQLETKDSYLDFLANLLTQLEHRLSPVLSPTYLEETNKPHQSETENTQQVSPLIGELQRHNYRLTQANERLALIMEYLEI